MSTPLYWQTQAFRLRPYYEICVNCGVIIFPPRDICPDCKKEALSNTPKSPDGKRHHKTLDKKILYGEPIPENVIIWDGGRSKERGG